MRLTTDNNLLGYGFEKALENLLQINAITYTSEYPQKCHLLPKTGKYIRAGYKYEKPWTRDASVNTSGGGSLLDPELARNTLFAVCEDSPEGVRIQEDNQWWDRLIWIVAAWEHYLITGDEDFLQTVYPIAKLSFQRTVNEYFNEKWGLFRGPAFMEDGISAYPAPVYKEGLFNPFVLRYELSHHIMCLSTNCAYYKAALCLAEMAKKVGESQQYDAFAPGLRHLCG